MKNDIINYKSACCSVNNNLVFISFFCHFKFKITVRFIRYSSQALCQESSLSHFKIMFSVKLNTDLDEWKCNFDYLTLYIHWIYCIIIQLLLLFIFRYWNIVLKNHRSLYRSRKTFRKYVFHRLLEWTYSI